MSEKLFLTSQEKENLKAAHRQEKNRRVADRIKSVLLADKGWTYRAIAEALLLDEQIISDHVNEYLTDKKLTLKSGGSVSKLDLTQTAELISHLENKTYLKIEEICAYVLATYGILYTVQGMTSWMHVHNFSYKKPKKTPAKADAEKQKEFAKIYKELVESTPQEEPILFADGVHPTMATKVTSGWIKTGTDKPIATTASRTRINLFGAINLATMGIVSDHYKTIDSDSMVNFFDLLRNTYPTAPKIHLILDNGPYNTSNQTKEAAPLYGIVLHYLPTYSPNLNPIERVWKVMNEYTRNNHFFKSAKDFRQEILNFFSSTWPQISEKMRNRINDNFQTLKPVVSF
jgi:transposase